MFDAVGRLERHFIFFNLFIFLLDKTLLFLISAQREELLLCLSILLVHRYTHTHTHVRFKPARKFLGVSLLSLPSSHLSVPQSCLTFLRVLDDLSDGFLQTVGSQHQLLSGLKDGGRCRGGAGPRGAAVRRRRVVVRKRRRWRDALRLLLLFSDGWGRNRMGYGGGLGLLVQGLQQRVQFLLQHTTLKTRGC